VKHQKQTRTHGVKHGYLGIRMGLHIFFDLSEMIDNNLNLSICCGKVNCQIKKLKTTKLKQQVISTCNNGKMSVDSTRVIMSHTKCILQRASINNCKVKFANLTLLTHTKDGTLNLN
jgi:hypothetical protein